jgi:3-oxoacyl-[acyl-carrier-protein] synthase III
MHHHHHDPIAKLIHGLHMLHHQLIELRRRNLEMSQASDNLTATLAAERTVIDGAVAFIEGTPDLITEAVRKALVDAGVDNAVVEAAVVAADTEAKAQTEALKAALVKGTGTKLPA